MIVLDWAQSYNRPAGVVLLFGSGLIGGAIVQCLGQFLGPHRARKIDWDWAELGANDSPNVMRAAIETLDMRAGARLSFVWAAGQSSFRTDPAGMDREFSALHSALEITRIIGKTVPQHMRACHIVSSAGGLFEGQVAVDTNAAPVPLRPYAEGKLRQERLILNEESFAVRHIYRPSSVYGHSRYMRHSLVSALVAAAVHVRPVSIVGRLSTQRDYVFAPDVGSFIAGRVLEPGDQQSAIHLLASARPASVSEVVHIVESRLGVTLQKQIDPNPTNALDNTYLPSSLPSDFRRTALAEGIALTTSSILRENYIRSWD